MSKWGSAYQAQDHAAQYFVIQNTSLAPDTISSIAQSVGGRRFLPCDTLLSSLCKVQALKAVVDYAIHNRLICA